MGSKTVFNPLLRKGFDKTYEEPFDIAAAMVQIWVADTAAIRALTTYGSDFDVGNYVNNKIYEFDASSSAADDGDLVLKPDAIDPGDPGRWLKKVQFANRDKIETQNELTFVQTNELGYIHVASEKIGASDVLFQVYNGNGTRIARFRNNGFLELLNGVNVGGIETVPNRMRIHNDGSTLFIRSYNIGQLIGNGFVALAWGRNNQPITAYTHHTIYANPLVTSGTHIGLINAYNGSTLKFQVLKDGGIRYSGLVQAGGIVTVTADGSADATVHTVEFDASSNTIEYELPEPENDSKGREFFIDVYNADNTIRLLAFSKTELDVDSITNPSGNTFRFNLNDTPDLSGVNIGDKVKIANSPNPGNNGNFDVTAVDDVSDYIEITNASGVIESSDTDTTLQLAVLDDSTLVLNEQRLYRAYSHRDYYRRIQPN